MPRGVTLPVTDPCRRRARAVVAAEGWWHEMNRDELAQLDDKGMAAWDAHKSGDFVGLFADRFEWIDDGTPAPMRSTDEIRAYVDAWFTAFPDLRTRETNRVIGEDSVAAEVEFTGTNTGPIMMGGRQMPATGRAVTGHATYFARAEDGKIVEFHSHPDAAGMMAQLGMMPS
ncbi:MAG TPA: ester cyclase [Actinocatenispora sp.]